MIFGGILAGGTGSRMESAKMPKQFLGVNGVPIFIWTLRTFLQIEKIDLIVVSINVDWEEKYYSMLDEYHVDKSRVVLTPGGDSRFVSLVNIVKKAAEFAGSENSLIVTHDCARLFVSKRIIEDNLTMAKEFDMVTTAVPTIDTMLYSEDGISSSKVPDRSKLWNDQGPQTFEIHKFLKYVNMINPSDLPNYIEAGKVYLSHNCKIGLVKGERFNFKITNDIDIKYAEFLLREKFVK